jgi:hypothetical protein
MKTSALAAAVSQEQEGRTNEATGEVDPPEGEDEPTGEGDDDETADEGADDTGTVEKVTPAGVKQLWGASDGKTFEKKADCVAHEEDLQKGCCPKTEAEQLRERLAKALKPDEPVETDAPVLEDIDRLSKVVAALPRRSREVSRSSRRGCIPSTASRTVSRTWRHCPVRSSPKDRGRWRRRRRICGS